MTVTGIPASLSRRTVFETSGRRRGTRLHGAGNAAIETGDRHRDLGDASLGHRLQNVDVARDQRRFGDDADWMVRLRQHFEDRSRDAPLPFDRLIRIGICPKRDRLRLVAGLGEFLCQQRRSIGLGVEFGFEIEPRRMPEIAMARARIAVDAAMLAAAVGIDRAVERDVGAVVARDDRLGGVLENFRLKGLQQTEAFPAVVEGFMDVGFEAPCLVRPRPPAATAFAVDDMISGWLCFRLASGGHG